MESIRTLLRTSLSFIIEYNIKKTEVARAKVDMNDYFDGRKLNDLLKDVDKDYKNLQDKDLLDFDLYKKAKQVTIAIKNERYKSIFLILKYGIPVIPAFVAAFLLRTIRTVGDSYVSSWQSNVLDHMKSEILLDTGDIVNKSFLMMAFKACFSMVGILANTISGSSMHQFSLNLRKGISEAIMSQDIEYFDKYSKGALISTLAEESDTVTFMMFRLPSNTLHEVVRLCSTTYFVYTVNEYSFQFTAAVIISALILALIQMGVWQFWRGTFSRQIGLRKLLSEKNYNLISNIKLIREFAMDIKETKQRSLIDEYCQEENAKQQMSNTLMWELMGFFQPLPIVLMITNINFGGLDRLKVGLLLANVEYMSIIQRAFTSLTHQLPNITEALVPALNIVDIMATTGKIEGDKQDPITTSDKDEKPKLRESTISFDRTQLSGKIEFKDVVFRYPSETRKKVLDGVTFGNNPHPLSTEKRIRNMGFVGATGCGKSTIINLIKRFYDANEGIVYLDDRDIKGYDPEWLRKQIAVVSQKTLLIENKTIRENISYGLNQIPNDEEILDACKKAAIYEEILKMPERLDTVILNENLSGGQLQRISIARALIRKPSILLLDEATSSLDPKNERIVQKAVNQMMNIRNNGSTIVIAHRLSTLMKMDTIFVMQDGKIIESGSHKELLLVEDGYYKDMWDTQLGLKDDDDDDEHDEDNNYANNTDCTTTTNTDYGLFGVEESKG
jgi:ABC-type multidrug transport system fused ATPase/permease subunit